LDKGLSRPEVRYDPKEGMIILTQNGKVTKKVSPYDLRLACRCAGCIDEFDGRKILKVEQVPKDVHPTNIHTKGNYAVAMVWSDGHRSSIYPFERIMSSELKDLK
jgi:ATP-binding protein involved in chromosome partitioning